MKYSKIMGYKNYVGRKAYQQAKSEGKSQEECKQSSKSAKENIPNYGDDKKTNNSYSSNNSSNNDNYDYSRPMDAQHLGDEWDDYTWSADDF